MRKMASVKKIQEIKPIPDADKICAYRVDGWWVVDSIGKYQVDDLVIYCEIDSWIPHEIAPFLSKGQEPKEYNGVKGERLRTVKLRGQLSQGLILPVKKSIFNDEHGIIEFIVSEHEGNSGSPACELGEDVSELLGIEKYEPPIPAQLAGEARGMFPSFIPKTDQERIQNLSTEIMLWCEEGLTFELTEKLDGSSMTVYVFEDDFGVCSRNLNLKESDTNSFWRICKSNELIEKIRKDGRNLALQGELIGEGIQGNPYKIKGQQFHLFDIFDIDNRKYFDPFSRWSFCMRYDINHVPVIASGKDLGTGEVDWILSWSDDKSKLNGDFWREGLVFKCDKDPQISFKAISNRFLLKKEKQLFTSSV